MAEPPPSSRAPSASQPAAQEEEEDDVWKTAQLDEFDEPQIPTSSSDSGLKQPAASGKSKLPPSALRASLQAVLGSGLSARTMPGPTNSKNTRVCGFDPAIFTRGKRASQGGAAAGEEELSPDTKQEDGASPVVVVTRLAGLRERRGRRFARSKSDQGLEEHELLQLDADKSPFGIGLEPPPPPPPPPPGGEEEEEEGGFSEQPR